MLRRIRAKLHPPSLISPSFRLYSSAALAKVRDNDDEHEHEPYGTDYGAGPSRIPYQSHHFTSSDFRHVQPVSAQSHPHPPFPSYITVRLLRTHLDKQSHGSYAQLDIFLRTIFQYPQAWNSPKGGSLMQDFNTMTRLELHVLIHHLIRHRKGNLAAGIACGVLSATPRHKRRRVFCLKTLDLLFRDRSIYRMVSVGSFTPKSTSSAPSKMMNPSLEDQTTCTPGRELNVLLDIMDSLQDVRYTRPFSLYELIIRQCVAEHLFDLAAKVYVGLVEEWVTEGRVAHGADPDDFHPGGGPPRKNNTEIDRKQKRKTLSVLLGHWWTGVRTWRLPGEILSPHDRLDLWHPKQLSLGEKMKNFPLPIATSPPSLVPQPKTLLLNAIVKSLLLDPRTASPKDFASSMRALAILANTVLSRTLPIVALGRLLQAFKTAPHKPDVYPDNIKTIPQDNAWAYTSFTQIHVTLMSLLFSPPISSHSMQLIAENQDIDHDSIEDRPIAEAMNQYMLPPLSWSSCMILVRYAFENLQRPSLLKRFMVYMKQLFNSGGKDPEAFNTLLKGSSALQLNSLASQADLALFGEQTHERPSHAPTPRKDRRFFFSSQRIEKGEQQQADQGIKDDPRNIEDFLKTEFEIGAGPLPNEESIVNLINHLTASSQFHRLEDLAYILEPYLDFSKSMSPEEVQVRLQRNDLTPGQSGRPRSQPLNHGIYIALIRGLEKSGSTGLAQRIFNLALRSEREMTRKLLKVNPNAIIPKEVRFPLEGYRLMIEVWSNECRTIKRSDKQPTSKEVPIGWMVPKEYERLPRGVAAGYMTLVTHHLAKISHDNKKFPKHYYTSLLRACRYRWKLAEDKQLYTGFKSEVKEIIQDIDQAGLEIPDVLIAKLQGRREGATFRWNNRKPIRQLQTEEGKLLDRMMGGRGIEILQEQEHDVPWESSSQ
ncbi:uncharacterized protein IL334_006454 [Kwoniella shivajii]|uniref:Uncharacterized protein n=1 Tax=Kwoniella shivajii TaxID=564305 RepID=A0ABZ1D6C7_9TREE|nr:hypothetical protein IL334_006454 [Kwoniella shivajii]